MRCFQYFFSFQLFLQSFCSISPAMRAPTRMYVYFSKFQRSNSAKTKNPVSQALVTMTGTFIDTIVVCTLTALVILTTDVWTLGLSAGELTSKSVEVSLGYVGVIIIAFSTVLFAFSTLIGWSYYGEKGLEFLMGTSIIKYYRIAYVFAVLIGSTMSLGLIWNLSDITNGMMAIPNLIGLLLLSKIIKSETNKYQHWRQCMG